MKLESSTTQDSQKLLVEVCSKIDGQPSLRPFFFNFFSDSVYIKCNKDLSLFSVGEIMEVEVIEVFKADGNAYLYCS